MSITRQSAIDTILNRIETVEFDVPSRSIASFYGSNTFNDEAMKEHMDEETYYSVKKAIQQKQKLDRKTADKVALAMKSWAMSKGATHYAHWFQPLTGKTAEKHDSFFTLTPAGEVREEFGADALTQQEPDGSSFPGGGLRSTFEARGYTAWDPSSPAFILEVGEGRTLCIPTIFVTYGGEAMDYKLPLLKSQKFLEESALPICQLFDTNVNKVSATLGWEQEYFLVDEALFLARPDLTITGRTIIGKHAPKGQQLEDHYFGSIPERVYAYMRDLETECHKLGIPVRTRHNEVAPAQYELAPMFEEVNVAVDHNQLLMDVMDRIAKRHKLRVLLHEKPFAGVNGSGKHNNWSMSTNTGVNLLAPGKEPGKNLRFLTFFVNTIMAVHQYADLLRASVTSASNDHRLGANEAPPAIISVYIGQYLSNLLDTVETGDEDMASNVKKALDLLDHIPDLELDNTDRNRTSPFAFTGNKFEIRMVGSSMNCASPMTVMNTIMGYQLKQFKNELDLLVATGMEQDQAILTIIKKYIAASKNIRFEGNGYGDEWKQEAAQRGLGNYPTTPEALDAFATDKVKNLFIQTGVFSEIELGAYHEVMLHNYVINLSIEARTLSEICEGIIIPTALNYQSQLINNALGMKELGFAPAAYAPQMDYINSCANHVVYIKKLLEKLAAEQNNLASLMTTREVAMAYCHTIKPVMDEIREHVDSLEGIVDDKEWPLPKYRELMFLR
jgi:glutamine synthetase